MADSSIRLCVSGAGRHCRSPLISLRVLAKHSYYILSPDARKSSRKEKMKLYNSAKAPKAVKRKNIIKLLFAIDRRSQSLELPGNFALANNVQPLGIKCSIVRRRRHVSITCLFLRRGLAGTAATMAADKWPTKRWFDYKASTANKWNARLQGLWSTLGKQGWEKDL